MIPLLAHPFASLAGLSVPVLVAIYMFRNRFRRHSVAGLFLWDSALRAREGGMVVRRVRTSLLFLLELLALVALTIAATDPRLPFRGAGRSLIVILDDSASMAAIGPEGAAREHALDEARKQVRGGRFEYVRFILAGVRPTVVDITTGNHWDDRSLLKRWRCLAPTADIDRAIALAAELSTSRTSVLVLTDHPPLEAPASGRVRWIACGRAVDNLGFVSARRATVADQDRLFVAVANQTALPLKIDVPIRVGDQVIATMELELAAGTTGSATLTLPADTPALTLSLPRDALAVDNTVTLLPDVPRRVGVTITVGDEQLREHVTAAVLATGLVDLRQPVPHVTIRDSAMDVPPRGCWSIRLFHPKHAQAYVGPFVTDFDHPVARGLSFGGMVWGAAEKMALPGVPVILAGNVPLVSARTLPGGRAIVGIQIAPDISTVHETPAWPSLFWNILQWRADHLPGPSRANVTVDVPATIVFPAGYDAATLNGPDGTVESIKIRDRQAVIRPILPGVYTARIDDVSLSVAAHFASASESNLRSLRTGKWGRWDDVESLERNFASWAWLLAVVAVVALTVHTILSARQPKRQEDDQ